MASVKDHAAKDAANLARLTKALEGLTADIAWMKAEIVRLGGNPPPPPPTGDDATILAELTDSSVAGMDKRLGPKADASILETADVWTRPQAATKDFGFKGVAQFGWYSEGLSVTAPPPANPSDPKPDFDYGSTELGIAAIDDQELVVNPSNPAATVSDGGPGPQGVGLYRLRIEEHADGVIEYAPVIPWNDPNVIPDRSAVTGHTASYGMGNKLGRPIQVARGRINRYDGGFALYDTSRGGVAYVGTIPTKTAWSPWSGEQLAPNLVPLCLAVSSQNEFVFVGVHDKATGTGKLVVIVNWGGRDNNNATFPADFDKPHPGLTQTGVVIGMKIIGTVDLPVKWPTSVSVATSRNTGSNRIEGEDGNAAYLSQWDMSTKAKRDAFLGKNDGWIAKWGKIVVASKYENKVVQLDATALYQGYRDQYFTTDEKYAESRPQHPDLAWWQVYETTNPSLWPYMKPEWTPTVTRTHNVTRPTVAWMLETNDGSFVIGTESGFLNWFKDDGFPADSLMVGLNITSIKDDKSQDGVRSGALVVTSRGTRTIYGVRNRKVDWKFQDLKLVDPVDAGTGDTHGVETRAVWVLGFDDKKVFQYRNAPLVLATQGGATFGMGPTGTDALEHLGSHDLPGHPVSGADSNVN